MDREAVLEKARNENKGMDELEGRAFETGSRIGLGVGAILTGILVVSNIILSNFDPNCVPMSFQLFVIFFAPQAAVYIFKFTKTHKVKDIIFGLIFAVFTLFFIAIHFYWLTMVR